MRRLLCWLGWHSWRSLDFGLDFVFVDQRGWKVCVHCVEVLPE